MVPNPRELFPMSFFERLFAKYTPKYGLKIVGEIISSYDSAADVRRIFKLYYLDQKNIDKLLSSFGVVEPKDLARREAWAFEDKSYHGQASTPPINGIEFKPAYS